MVARAALLSRLVAVSGRTTGAIETGQTRGGYAARCRDPNTRTKAEAYTGDIYSCTSLE